MGLNHHRQAAADIYETLGCGWRTDAEGRGETGAAGRGLGDGKVRGAGKKRKGLMRRLMQYPGVRYRADRTLMTGKLGIFGMNVIRLDKPDEADKQDAKQGENPEHHAPVLLSSATQEKITPQALCDLITQAGFFGLIPDVHGPLGMRCSSRWPGSTTVAASVRFFTIRTTPSGAWSGRG